MSMQEYMDYGGMTACCLWLCNAFALPAYGKELKEMLGLEAARQLCRCQKRSSGFPSGQEQQGHVPERIY